MSGFATIADIRARCIVDPPPGGCWHWQGAMQRSGPSIWTFDHARGCKRAMTGCRAVFEIAHGRSPLPGWTAFRRCTSRDCVNPLHVGEVRSRAELGEHWRRQGRYVGQNIESRRANMAKARAAAGLTETPADVVRALRAEPAHLSHAEVSRRFNLSPQLVGDIRAGRSRRGVA